MSDLRRRIEIGLISCFVGLCCGYATRYFRVPLVDIAGDLRPHPTHHPMLPNPAAIGATVTSASQLVISTHIDAEPPNVINVQLEKFGRIRKITLLYTNPNKDFDIKSEAVKRWGQFELSSSVDLKDAGYFRDDSRRLVWLLWPPRGEGPGRTPFELSVQSLGLPSPASSGTSNIDVEPED